MIGVILWSDPAAMKAVIWCEDHGDLAFLSRADAMHVTEGFVDVGDVVEFDLQLRRSTRSVQNLKVLSEGKGASLVDDLKTLDRPAGPDVAAFNTAEVIPFRLGAAPATYRDAPAQVQRSG